MSLTPEQTKAMEYLAAAANDYAATLPPSVRGPFIREAQAAIKILEGEPPKAQDHG